MDNTAEKMPSDTAVREQHELTTAVNSSPYLRGFQPRAYSLYPERYVKPRAFLEQVGIEKIGELVQHGLSLGQISALLDVSGRVIRRWIQEDRLRVLEIEEARRFAADEERVQAKNVLYDAKLYPDTARAKAIADHHQWTAERWDKDLYGTKQVRVEANLNAQVSYSFNIGQVAPREPVRRVLEGVFEQVSELPGLESKPSLDFSKEPV